MSIPLRILLIEDSEDDALLLLRELRNGGYDPIYERVDTLEALEASVADRTWDIVTGDYAIPGFGGLAALRYLQDKGVDTPFIIVSGQIGEELAVEAMRNGAFDYVMKGNLKRLVPTIERELRDAEIRRQKKLAEEELSLERQRLGDIANNADCGLFLLDGHAKIIHANPLAEEWFGPLDTLAGKCSWDILDLDDPEHESAVLKVIKTGQPARTEVFTKTVEGEKRFFFLSAAPLADRNGDVRQITKVVVDITERKQGEELSKALNEINESLRSTLDFDEIMQRVAAESTRALGLESCGVILRDGDDWVISHVHNLPADRIGVHLMDSDFPYVRIAAEIKDPVAVDDAERDPRVDPAVMRQYGVRSVLVAPLVSNDGTIGVIGWHRHSGAQAFTTQQIDFAKKLAASTSLALDNIRLYEAEHRVAETLQEALLAMPEAISGLEFGYIYKSATETARVGGDFFDLFELNHDRVGIVIGDVAGYGLEAAALTSIVKSTIKAYAFEDLFPASIMAKTNELIGKADLPETDFTTVFFGVLDKKTGHLAYCNAGHPPAIICRRAGGPREWLAAGSQAIGVLPKTTFIDTSAIMGAGDRLILYTDGVTGAKRNGAVFGEEKFLRALPANGKSAVDRVPQIIMDKVIKYTGGALVDDVAVLAVSLSDR